MLFIKHRINLIEDLVNVPKNFGVEVDIRYEGEKLILQHDPFKSGELFENFLNFFNHEFIILNVKTEGIEDEILNLLNKKNIKNYFFLDVSFPALIKLVRKGEKNIAIRFSEYEPIEQAIALKGMVHWVWADCFTKFPFSETSYEKIKNDFKICLVSPELQGHDKEMILSFKEKIKNYKVDAVCTKYPELY